LRARAKELELKKGQLAMHSSKDQRWPENRVFHRYRTQPPIDVIAHAATLARGSCRDIGLGGASVTLPIVLGVGDELTLTIKLPDFQEPLQLSAVVRNKSGSRYGFEFLHLTSRDRERIVNFGRDATISAYLFTPDPAIVRSAQQSLQGMGVTQVWRGHPESLPVPNPHIIIIDSDWPDFAEVAQLMRSESADRRIIIVALVARDVTSKTIAEAAADVLLYKPLPRNWVERVLGTAVKLLSGREGDKDIVWS
jgi:hypothetical protein